MKLDQVIYDERILLVPYKPHHVKKYHSWMQDPEIQRLTASEPLTLKEEYEMQQTWFNDEDKLTFIILDKLKWKRRQNKFFEDGNVIANLSPEVLSKITPFEEHSMIGDVNLYFSEDEDEGEDSTKFCEISIMIAEKDYKRKGYATDVIQMVCNFSRKYFNLCYIVAKIGIDNEPSINLFKEKLNFYVHSKSDVFQELTLRLDFKENNLNTKQSLENNCQPSFNHKMTLTNYSDLYCNLAPSFSQSA